MRKKLAVLTFAFVSIACSGASRSSERFPLSESSATAQWAASFTGTAPHVVAVLRMHPSIQPRDVSSVFPRNSPSDRVSVMAIMNSRQQDYYDGGIGVLHDVPRWIDPLRPAPGQRDPGFVFLGQAASGVRAYRPTSDEPKGARLFVLPSSTWIFAMGAAAYRLEWALASRAAEPPTLDALPGIFMESTYRIDPARAQRLRVIRGGDRVIGYGEVTYLVADPRGGLKMPVGLKLVFPDDSSAHVAAEDAARLLASAARDGTVDAVFGGSSRSSDPIIVERYGATVVFRPLLAR